MRSLLSAFVLALVALVLLAHPDAQARTTKKSKKAKAAAVAAAAAALAAPPRAAARQPVRSRDGEAEARLIEIYRLIGAARGREALAKAEALVRDHPNFQLAQLVYGDLLSSQSRAVRVMGDVPDTTARAAGPMLADLRDESMLRLKALRERPPAGSLPSQFLTLSVRNKHAIAVDTSRARLYLFENNASGTRLIADYYISVGKLGIEKAVEGDLRTPLGVYFITNTLNPKTLKDFYGSGALPINYPNPYDVKRGKTGSGIWLHGTPSSQFARAPKATDGCVVLANPDLERILASVEVRTTPVVIAPQLTWVQPQNLRVDAKAFEDTLQAWRVAKSSGSVERTLGFYSNDFNSNGKTLMVWSQFLRDEIAKNRGRELQLKDLSVLSWKDTTDTMVVTFGEVADGAQSGATRRQYWMRQGSQWKIFYEGVIG
jgi:murein L,D-transpeptidase YafK